MDARVGGGPVSSFSQPHAVTVRFFVFFVWWAPKGRGRFAGYLLTFKITLGNTRLKAFLCQFVKGLKKKKNEEKIEPL